MIVALRVTNLPSMPMRFALDIMSAFKAAGIPLKIDVDPALYMDFNRGDDSAYCLNFRASLNQEPVTPINFYSVQQQITNVLKRHGWSNQITVHVQRYVEGAV